MYINLHILSFSIFIGHDWVLLDSCYLSDQKNSLHIRSWHDFFAKLGVEDFISIKPRDVHLTKENIVSIHEQ